MTGFIIICCFIVCFIPVSLSLLRHYSFEVFRSDLKRARNLVILTGAGVSAESGIPTFRDVGGMWRNKYELSKFANPHFFKNDPASVWEFYHYRRELALSKKPNPAHFAIAECEKWFNETGRGFTLITTNTDGLHQRADSHNILEMHGSLFETRCTECNDIEKNFDSPICEALRAKENFANTTFVKSSIPVKDLPHCKKCGGLLRPNVIWFNELLEKNSSKKAWKILDLTDLLLIVGTSSKVFPVALFGHHVAHRGMPVAEFNIRKGRYTNNYMYYFKGPAGKILPLVLKKNLDKNFRLPEIDSS